MKEKSLLKNEDGSVLIISMLILVALTLLGVSATTTSTIEIQIARNERLHKLTFYAADGGTEAGQELLEQNICCPGGFTANYDDRTKIGDSIMVEASSLAFWQNTSASATIPSDTNRDFYLTADYGHTNLTVGGGTATSTGGALQMAAGYEGKAKGAAGGGAHMLYDIYSQHIGRANGESIIMVRWRHLIGQEEDCIY